MRNHSGGRTLKRRIIALVAAYAVALSSLVASLGAAHAAAEAAGNPLGVFCHGAADGTAFPVGQGNSGICIDGCCIGCLMPLAALPPPPVAALPSLAAVGYRVALPASIALRDARTAKAHRSRAPPFGA